MSFPIFADHFAWRVFDRKKAVKFFKDIFDYKEQAEFTIYFDEEKTQVAECTAMQPGNKAKNLPFTAMIPFGDISQEYILQPEVFISEGNPGSIVHDWCLKHGSSLHHIAVSCPENSTVEEEMHRWLDLGWVEGFTSDVIKCDDLHQVFSKPSPILGVVFEIIKRKEFGFCGSSIKVLMQNSRGD